MKLVYLDTSNLALLTKVRSESSKDFQSFLERWRKQSYILAFSEAHLYEITRYGSNEGKQLRFDLLKEMLPIRAEMGIFHKEIMSALVRKRIWGITVKNPDVYSKMFSDIICLPKHILNLYAYAEADYFELSHLSHEIFKIAWQTKSFKLQNKARKKIRLEDVPEILPHETKNHFQTILQNTENAFNKTLNSSVSHSKAIINALELSKRLFSQADEVGFRKAFADEMNVDINDNRNLRKPIDSLGDKLMFSNKIKFTLSQILNNSEKVVNYLADKILIEDCPGQWLKKHVEYQLCKNNDFEPSNEVDIKHISHLPYVDILIADKRIVAATNQVLRSTNRLKRFDKVNPPISVPNTIESLENALFGNH